MNKRQLKLAAVAITAVLVVSVMGFVICNRVELAKAMHVDKSNGKLLYFYIPC